jgi:hypothetical protein
MGPVSHASVGVPRRILWAVVDIWMLTLRRRDCTKDWHGAIHLMDIQHGYTKDRSCSDRDERSIGASTNMRNFRLLSNSRHGSFKTL